MTGAPASETARAHGSASQANRRDPAEDHANDVSGRCADGEPDADLTGPSGDAVRHETVRADRDQHNRQQAEERQGRHGDLHREERQRQQRRQRTFPENGKARILLVDRAPDEIQRAAFIERAPRDDRRRQVVGLEDWISAEDNIRLLDAIGSDYVAVYYDAHNIAPRVKDIYAEPGLLGTRIHQIHLKNANMLLSSPGGRLDWPRMARESTRSSTAAGTCSRPALRPKTSSPTPAPTSGRMNQTFRMPPPPTA